MCRLVEAFPTSFKEQFDLFSSHGVVVSPHGAGLVNALYMAPMSAVVELFPYHMDHNLYPTLCWNSGVGNYPIHSINGSIVWRRDLVRCRHNAPV